MKCVYCSSEKIVKNGKSNQGKQRYLCKDCGKI
ncbi:IS1/IS1595 family N-terminal zinc-binding domain-containing protein, partial [Sulfurihydrogenibium azorense]|nr:IS1 family transposase [Sulfurihydrogenibium azorense]MDM7274436.1 IS1 family transposase [Sulfurihydrogenibium azorense]